MVVFIETVVFIVRTWLKECVGHGTDEGDDRQVQLTQVKPEKEVDLAVELVRRACQ